MRLRIFRASRQDALYFCDDIGATTGLYRRVSSMIYRLLSPRPLNPINHPITHCVPSYVCNIIIMYISPISLSLSPLFLSLPPFLSLSPPSLSLSLTRSIRTQYNTIRFMYVCVYFDETRNRKRENINGRRLLIFSQETWSVHVYHFCRIPNLVNNNDNYNHNNDNN